jgi:hypothetical protein
VCATMSAKVTVGSVRLRFRFPVCLLDRRVAKIQAAASGTSLGPCGWTKATFPRLVEVLPRVEELDFTSLRGDNDTGPPGRNKRERIHEIRWPMAWAMEERLNPAVVLGACY